MQVLRSSLQSHGAHHLHLLPPYNILILQSVLGKDAQASSTDIIPRVGQPAYLILQQTSTVVPQLVSTSGLLLRPESQMLQFSQYVTPVTVVSHILVTDHLTVSWVFSLIPSPRANS